MPGLRSGPGSCSERSEMSTHNQPPEPKSHPKDPVTILTVMLSVVASFFGVQKEANRRRDFSSGKFWHFLVAGLVFVIVFILAIWGFVQYLMAVTPTDHP